MASLKRYRLELLAVASITIFYFVSRLYNLLELPIFTDEAIYMRWAQYLLGDFKFWDYSITDGKQPLYIWFVTALMVFVKDPLLAGRLVSVLAGFGTMVGMFFLSREIFKNKWIGILAAGLYAVYPFALVYDRMALYDSLVGTFSVWGLYCVVRFARFPGVITAVVLGIVGGLGALNKSNGFFTIYLLPFSLLLFDLKAKNLKQRFFRWIAFAVVAAIIAFGMYSLLRLSPFFHIIDQKNATFVYTYAEWIQHPFRFFWGNFWAGQRDWFVKYFGYVYMLLTIAAFFIKREYLREKLLLVIWFILPYLALALFGKTLYPRYILFMTLSLLPLVAYTIYWSYSVIKKKYVFLVLCVAILYFPLRSFVSVLTDFATAPIPLSDREQYNNDWPSGTGVRESAAFFKEEAKKEKIAVLTEGTFGLMPFAYELYFHDNKQIMVKGFWPVSEATMQDAIKTSKTMPTFVVFYQPCPSCPSPGTAPQEWPLEKIKEYKKVKENTSLTVYKVVQ